MARVSKFGLVKFLCENGGFFLSRIVTRNVPSILMYHRFSREPENGKVSEHGFEQQLIYLKRYFNPVPLQKLVGCILNGSNFPDNSVAITIDDGYEDFHSIAWPLLEKYNIPATVYVASNFIDGRIWLWPDKISYILDSTVKNTLDLSDTAIDRSFTLDSHRNKSTCWDGMITYCLTLNQEQQESFITRISDDLGVEVPETPVKEYMAMNWDQVREIHNSRIEIGAHTANHPVMSRLNEQELVEEISHCRSRIEKAIDTEIKSFCYPNGQPFDYNEEIKQLIKDSGFNNATVAFYDDKNLQDLYELRRHSVASGLYQFKKCINGINHLSSLINRNGH